jgi:SPP1 family predicted phage head-tail adaptor
MSGRGAGVVLAGRMRQRVRIEAPALTADGLGGTTRAWQTVATVWAEIRTLSGNERMAAGQLASQVTHRILLRYRTDVTQEMRILFGTRVFAIRAVLEKDGRRRALEILAEEGAGS